jgi:CheY-like chemotaxis protein
VPGATGRVLVVDDSQIIRQLIRVILELDGFEVMTAADGAECLEAVGEYRPDVITMDLVMPRLDGLRTVERLRRAPAGREVPLVVVSATPVGPRLSGVDAVVAKPFEPAELVRTVRRLRLHGRSGAVRLAKSLAG